MFKLCNYVKDDGRPCNSPAKRHLNFCHYHHDALLRERRMSRARQRYLRAITKEVSPNSLPAVRAAIQYVKEGISCRMVDEKRGQLALYGLRIMVSNLRYAAKHSGAGPSLADQRFAAESASLDV
jgi:hypothetical protein